MKKINFIYILILLSARILEADCDRCKKFFFSFTEAEQNKIKKNKAFKLAFFCHELTVEEVKAALKGINMEDLRYKMIGLHEIPEYLDAGPWLGSYDYNPAPSAILRYKLNGHKCKAEGCLYLAEQIRKYLDAKEEAEKRAYEQAQEAREKRTIDRYNSSISELKND